MRNTPSREEILLRARLVRRWFRRIKQQLNPNKTSLNDSPIFFVNSFPKSGTHLLTQIIKGFTLLGAAVDSGLPAIITYDGYSGRERSINEILTALTRLMPGDIAYGHVHADPKITSLLDQDIFSTYFLLRDPRDVVVSHVHYVTEMEKNHVHHHHYRYILQDFDQRLQASIQGIQSNSSTDGMPNIYERLAPYVGWMDCPEILTVHFEDLIKQQEETLKKIVNQAVQHRFQLDCSQGQAIKILSKCINPQSSPTFRSGKIGSWKSSFNKEHKQTFKEITGDLLIRLGYEDNSNW